MAVRIIWTEGTNRFSVICDSPYEIVKQLRWLYRRFADNMSAINLPRHCHYATFMKAFWPAWDRLNQPSIDIIPLD